MIMDVDETKAIIVIFFAIIGVLSCVVWVLRALMNEIINYVNRTD